MKTVFSSREIAHIWAHCKAPHGRSPSAMRFDGAALYSYATVIARRLPDRKRQAVFIVDRASFSNSTAKHQGRAHCAIPESAKTFVVRIGERGQTLNLTPAGVVAHYVKRAEEIDAAEPSRYAHKRAEQWQSATALYRDALDAAEFFGLGTVRLSQLIAKREANAANAAQVLAERARKLDAAKKAKAIREANERKARNERNALAYLNGELPPQWVNLDAKADALATLPDELCARFVAEVEKRNAAFLDAWRAGESVHGPAIPLHSLPVMLRREGAEVVTSKGARVSLDTARRAWCFISAARAKGWHRNGETEQGTPESAPPRVFAIDGYQLDAVNEAGIVAGCHRIGWTELERFAKAENLSA